MIDNSNVLIYCHGLPGSAEELNFLGKHDTLPTHVFGPQQPESDILSATVDRNIHLIGFSLGAMAAIKLSARYEHAVGSLSLISAAAPLELGDFLPAMAGSVVFQTASRSALLLKVLTTLQKAGATLASELVVSAMFKESPDSEKNLLNDPKFKQALVAGFKESYGVNNVAYRAAIGEYVQPWAHHLEKITCPVNIYHGELDNWAPVDMAYALQSRISSEAQVIEYPGLGHFSTLRKVMMN